MNNNLKLYLWHSLQSFPWMFFFLQLFASQMSCMLGFLNRIALILSCHMPSKAKPTKKSIIWYLIHVSEHLAISTEWVTVNFYSFSSMCLLLFFSQYNSFPHLPRIACFARFPPLSVKGRRKYHGPSPECM